MQSKNNQANWRMFRGLVAASIAAACFLPRAEARTVTWTGGGDGSTWSDGRNWDGTAPANGDDVRVGATTVNDISGISLRSLAFIGAGGWTLSGAPISLQAGAWGGLTTESGVTGSCTVSAPLVLEAGEVWFNPSVSRKEVSITGSISGPGRLVKTGFGNLVLKAENTYTGGTYYTNGVLYVQSPGALGTGQLDMGKSFNVNGVNYCWLYVSGFGTTVDDFVISNKIVAAGESQNAGTFEVYGNVTFKGDIEFDGQCRLRGGNTIRYLGTCNKTGAGQNITIQNGGTHIFEVPISWSPNYIYGDGNGTFQFNAPGNVYKSAMLSQATLKAGAVGALANVEHYYGGTGAGGWIDLNGFDQQITSLHDQNASFTARSHGVKSADKATLTISGSADNHFSGQFNGAASLNWAPTADRTFTVSNTTWSTTGAITVSAGTVKFVDGTTAPNLTGLTVAAGAAFRMDGRSSIGEDVAVTLDEGATLEIYGDLGFSSFKVGTTSYSGGLTYGGRNAARPVDVVLDEIDGTGTFVLPVSEPTTVDATWDAGGGADTGLSTAANWDGDTTPDLSSGETLAHFTAGTLATASGIVRFKGVDVVPEAAGRTFRFEGAPGSRFDLYQGGVSFTGNSPDYTGVLDMALPVRAMAEQTWDFRRGSCTAAAIYLTNSISSYSPIAHVNFGGDSTIYLGGDNSDFTANFVQTSGTVNVLSETALGSTTSGKYILQNPNKNAHLNFSGGTFGRALQLSGMDQGCMSFAEGTTTVFTNFISTQQNNVRYDMNAGSRFVLAGGSSFATLFIPRGSLGVTVFTNVPSAGLNLWMDGGNAVTELGVATNVLGGSFLVAAGSILKTTVPYALYSGKLSLGVAYAGGGGTLDLCGTDQRLTDLTTSDVDTFNATQSNLWATVGNPRIHSDEPGTFHYAGSGAKKFFVKFTGQAGFSYEPTANVQGTLRDASTSSGGLTVKNGTLTFGAEGSWTNCTAVTIAGGVLRVPRGSTGSGSSYDAGTFSRHTSLYVPYGSTGKVQLDAGVSQDMEFLYLEDENGKWRKQSLGTWGASGVAAHTHACFTGAGVVRFVGDGKGTSIIFK